MTRNMLSGKGPDKPRKNAPSGGNRGIIVVLVGFTAAAIIAIAGFAVLTTNSGVNAGNFTPNNAGLLELGTQAPGFTAETVGGGNLSAGDDSGDGKAMMLVFFATWCPHCQNEAPIISDMKSQYPDLQVVMVGTDDVQGDNPAKVREFVDRYDISSHTIYDPSLGPRYNVVGYPTVYFIDGSEEIVAANSGEAPREVYEDWAEEALNS